MNLTFKLWHFIVVKMMMISLFETIRIEAQTLQPTGNLNSQPARSLLERSVVEKGKFLFYVPDDSEVFNRLKEATVHLNYYDDYIPKDYLELSSAGQNKNKYSHQSEVNQWKNSPEQEVHSLDNESKLQYLVRRINLSNTGFSREKTQFYKLSDPHRTRKSATTTARPIYDQIPRPMLFNEGREADSFR